MPEIAFSNTEKEEIVGKIKSYFREELDQEIGGFDAEFLLDFFAGEVGAYFYNRGLYDAQAVLAAKFDEMGDVILQLEKPVQSKK